MRQSSLSPFHPNHPAFAKVLTTPEMLGGIIGIVLILALGFGVLFTSGGATAEQIKTDITTKKDEIQKQKELEALLVRLKKEADSNTSTLLTLQSGEIASVKIFDFLKKLEGFQVDPLNLPVPHNSIEIFHVQQIIQEPSTAAPAPDPAVASGGSNLFSPELAPFSAPELASLNLNVPAEHYMYKISAKGSYLGLTNFVRKLATYSPLVGIKGLEMKLDDKAPSVLFFRGITAKSSSSLIDKVESTPSSKTAPEALIEGESSTPPSSPSVSLASAGGGKPIGTPLVMDLTLDIFLKTNAQGINAAEAIPADTATPSATP